MAYVCSRYPDCYSFVMAHAKTLKPMGSLAGPELRRLRYNAHKEFNRLYQSGIMSKRDAYQWLGMIVQAPMAHAHIGHDRAGAYGPRPHWASGRVLLSGGHPGEQETVSGTDGREGAVRKGIWR